MGDAVVTVGQAAAVAGPVAPRASAAPLTACGEQIKTGGGGGEERRGEEEEEERRTSSR